MDQRDFSERFIKAMLLTERALTHKARRTVDKRQTTRNDVEVDGSDTHENPKNE